MKAIVRAAYGGPEQLHVREVPMPAPGPNDVLVRVRAFGLNRAEQYFREGRWGEVHAISGIECVGEVQFDPSGRLPAGQSVFALMGGMGRSIAGSYAEFACVPASNVVPLRSSLDWASLAAIPESYATAWACLMDNLALQAGQTLLVRGCTSALGQAALNIARHAGARVIGSVRTNDRAERARELGAQWVFVEDESLPERVRDVSPAGLDAVLDLVGATTVLGSLQLLRRGGRVCWAGFLGGGAPIERLDPLQHLASGRQLSFFASAFVFGTPEYPLHEIPFQRLVDDVASGAYQAAPARVFAFDDIQRAHGLLDQQAAGGKIVVVV
jgi:NADPH:quinone reductase-like Zn-dependent oxidoreductase